MSDTTKPSLLVLGGVGFVGRHLVAHLVAEKACAMIRVVDKVLPATAYLSDQHKAAFDAIEFIQGNLVSPATVKKAFTLEGAEFDYVINLAGETKMGQTDEIYDEKVRLLSVNCAKEAAERNINVYIELSTAQVYEADKKPSTETSKTKPWTGLAKAKLKAEEEIRDLSGLNLIIVRPAIIYGPFDIYGITPRLVIGAVYKELKEEMKLLWTKDLRLNTVHVSDVVRALWHLCSAGKIGETYNLADQGDTNQGMVNGIVGKLFDIKTGFQGSIVSNFAKLNLKSVTEDVNDKHLAPWSSICKTEGITSTPLTPYLDQELLYNNSLSVNGSKICQDTGFTYEKTGITLDLCKDVLTEFANLNAFPKSMVNE